MNLKSHGAAAFIFAAALSIATLSIATSSADAQEGVKCKLLATVDACVKCSLQKKSSAKFTTGGINDWCAKQVAQNAGRRKK